jgi:predicted nucleic-acid-binding protein
MQAVDTNLVVRYLTGDDPGQSAKVRRIIGKKPVFIPRTVILEAEWVLRGVYEWPSTQVIPALRALAGLPEITMEDAKLVAQAMNWAEAGMDFADALHLAASVACETFLTFDRRLARSAGRQSRIRVAAP